MSNSPPVQAARTRITEPRATKPNTSWTQQRVAMARPGIPWRPSSRQRQHPTLTTRWPARTRQSRNSARRGSPRPPCGATPSGQPPLPHSPPLPSAVSRSPPIMPDSTCPCSPTTRHRLLEVHPARSTTRLRLPRRLPPARARLRRTNAWRRHPPTDVNWNRTPPAGVSAAGISTPLPPGMAAGLTGTSTYARAATTTTAILGRLSRGFRHDAGCLGGVS